MRHFFPPPDTACETIPESVLSVQALSLTFAGRQLLSEISLHVARGESVALLGRDGAGKTCCFDAIAGRIGVRSGKILLNGVDVTRKPAEQRAKLGLGYLAEEVSVFAGMTVEENLLAALEFSEPEPASRAERLEGLLAAYGLTPLRFQPAFSVSGGESRRCEVARAMAQNPSILMLDQPFRGLDPEAVRATVRMIREIQSRGVAVLVSDYDLYDLVDVIDRAFVLDEGRLIFAGSRDELLTDPVVKELFLGAGFAAGHLERRFDPRRLLRRVVKMENA
jgi:lipopolysaccharide export system ATP-binding protein